MDTLPGRTVQITNARSLEPDLDREGFTLVSHASSIVDFDRIQEDPEIDQRYIDEMADLLARVTGATRDLHVGWREETLWRRGEGQVGAPLERQASSLPPR
jgi:hypothetical protein